MKNHELWVISINTLEEKISKDRIETHWNIIRILGEEKMYCYCIYQKIQKLYNKIVFWDNISNPSYIEVLTTYKHLAFTSNLPSG